MRIIRNRYGTETAVSLKRKMDLVQREMSMVTGYKWIDQIILNDNKEKFINRAGVHIVFKLYRLRG